MRDELIKKLSTELSLPIESERQVVYILVQIRKLMDRDKISKTDYAELRLFCNWALHIDLSNPTVKSKLEFINALGWKIPHNQLAPDQLMKCSEVLSLESARTEFLNFIRRCELNRTLKHVFQPLWWATLLRQYFRIIADCPLVFTGKDIQVKNIKTATVIGYEVLDPREFGDEIECVFKIEWVVEFENGLKVRIPLPLAFEKATFVFGRAGRSRA